MPHLSLLGCGSSAIAQIYEPVQDPPSKIRRASTSHTVQESRAAQDNVSLKNTSVSEHINWHKTWEEYVRGHVVSQTAAKLIRSFLLKTVAAGASPDKADNSDAEDSVEDPEIAPLKLSMETLRQVLARPTLEAAENEDEPKLDSMGKKLRTALVKKGLKNEYHNSIDISWKVWSTPLTDEAAGDKECPGHMFPDSCVVEGDGREQKQNICRICSLSGR